MKAATLPDFGGPDALRVTDVPLPEMGPNHVFIRVNAAGVNRADVLQRRGLYPSPPGSPPWPGLEVAGIVERVGADVDLVTPGQRVCALVSGGGYAEYVACDASLVLPVPDGLTDIEAAALPEAVCTVWSNFRVGGIPGARSLLIHGGSGGVGSTAIQLAKAFGVHVIVTAGGPERVARCLELGADAAVDYRDPTADFTAAAAANGGVDMVLDCIGGEYLARNLDALKDDGTLVVIGTQRGAKAELNLSSLLARRLTIAGTSLRSRPLAQRAAIIADVRDTVWGLIPERVRPIIHEVFELDDVATAHRLMDDGGAFGKVVLQVA